MNRYRKYLWLIVVMVSVALGGPAWGATVYTKSISGTVYYDNTATSCDDVTAADTSSHLQGAAVAASANGTLYICSGTYTGNEIDSDDQELDISNSETPITIQGIGKVIIDAEATQGYCLHSVASVITLRNIEFLGANTQNVYIQATGAPKSGIVVDNIYSHHSEGNTASGLAFKGADATNIISATVTDSLFSYNKAHGAIASGFPDGVTYTNCISEYNGQGTTGVHGFSSYAAWTDLDGGWANPGGTIYSQDIGPKIAYACTYEGANASNPARLTKNTATPTTPGVGEWGYSGTTLYVNVGADPADGADEYIKYTYWHPQNVNYVSCTSRYNQWNGSNGGAGFQWDNGNDGGYADGCLSHDNEGTGFRVNRSDNIVVRNSLSLNNGYDTTTGATTNWGHGMDVRNYSQTVDFFFNTIDQSGDDGIYIQDDVVDVDITNCIITRATDYAVLTSTTDTTSIDLDYNCLPTTGGFANANDTSGEDTKTNTVDAAPLFVNATDLNFHLLFGSPAIDTGTDVSVTSDKDAQVRPYGLGYDMGAYEYIGRGENVYKGYLDDESTITYPDDILDGYFYNGYGTDESPVY